MLLREVMELLEEQSPLYYACDWDNSGLLAGRSNQDIRKIYIALDASDEAVEEAVLEDAPSADLWRNEARCCRGFYRKAPYETDRK